MKRILIGCIVSIFTFLAGYLVVPQRSEQLPVAGQRNVQPETKPQPEENIPAVTDRADQVFGIPKGFVPEFRNLPDFDEIDESVDESVFNNRLIDVLESDGLYRESEVVAKSGERWLGLFQRGSKYTLTMAKAKVSRLPSTSYPDDEFDTRLKFDKPGVPIFAVRNIPGLKAGPVKTVYHRPSWREIDERNLEIQPMQTGYDRMFDLGEDQYTLRVSTGITKGGTRVAVLVLEHGDQHQILRQAYYDSTNGKTIIGDLLWVGDLDGDGRLDLYFDEFNEKGVFAAELHLSSQAEPGKLVKLAAVFVTAGC